MARETGGTGETGKKFSRGSAGRAPQIHGAGPTGREKLLPAHLCYAVHNIYRVLLLNVLVNDWRNTKI